VVATKAAALNTNRRKKMSFMSRVQIATYILLEIAKSGDTPYPLHNADRVSTSYAEQIIRQLKASGFVKSSRGPGGGYVLTKPASEITLGEIYDSVMSKDNDGLGLDAKIDDAFSDAKDTALLKLDDTALSQLI
jgi:Rrf2 family protein